VKKGVSSEEMIEAGQKAIKAGMTLSVTAILGLGGKERSFEHAKRTAYVLNEIKPHYTAFLTLMIVENTPLYFKALRGEFKPLNQTELLNSDQAVLSSTQELLHISLRIRSHVVCLVCISVLAC